MLLERDVQYLAFWFYGAKKKKEGKQTSYRKL